MNLVTETHGWEKGRPSLEELALNFFHEAEKPAEDWKIGAEWELIGFNRKTNKRLHLLDIQQMLTQFQQLFGGQAIFEKEQLIGVDLDQNELAGSSLTLEPGGQFEFSGPPVANLFGLKKQLLLYLHALQTISQSNDFYFIASGYDPLSQVKTIPLMPKERYHIMQEYLSTIGSSAVDMMRGSAAFQLSFDYQDETDWHHKLLVSQWLTPYVLLLFSNAYIAECKPLKLHSQRAFLWQNLDPSRVGFIAKSFNESFSYLDYIQLALDTPMLTIIRDSVPLNFSGKSFPNFWQGEMQVLPQPGDWENHLRSLFVWTRAKNCLEFRVADSGSLSANLALTAFLVGLLYDHKNRQLLAERALSFGLTNTINTTQQIMEKGWQAQFTQRNFLQQETEFLWGIAKEGLKRLRLDPNFIIEDVLIPLDQLKKTEHLKQELHQEKDLTTHKILAKLQEYAMFLS